jgi:Resolvase, N terminal domain
MTAIYARVSTLDQEPANQLQELRRYVEARGWTAVEYVDRGVSGAKDRRPALDQLLADAKRRRFDVLVCWRLDRLGRSLKHLITLLDDLQARDRVRLVGRRDRCHHARRQAADAHPRRDRRVREGAHSRTRAGGPGARQAPKAGGWGDRGRPGRRSRCPAALYVRPLASEASRSRPRLAGSVRDLFKTSNRALRASSESNSASHLLSRCVLRRRLVRFVSRQSRGRINPCRNKLCVGRQRAVCPRQQELDGFQTSRLTDSASIGGATESSHERFEVRPAARFGSEV